MKILNILTLLTFCLLPACGASTKGTDTMTQGLLGTSPYIALESGNLIPTGTGIKGQGTIAFKDPVGEIGARKSYSLAFGLEDGGSLTLVTNADENLRNGVEIKFTRTGNIVAAAITVGTKTSGAKNFPTVDGSQQLRLTVDVHNNESPAHILIWNGNDFSAVNAVLDSESDDAAPGQGRGIFWGLKLGQATVTEATLGAAKFSGE